MHMEQKQHQVSVVSLVCPSITFCPPFGEAEAADVQSRRDEPPDVRGKCKYGTG